MTYLALLWRQKSFAFFTDPIAWQGAVDEADNWQQKAADIRPRCPPAKDSPEPSSAPSTRASESL